jgi:uncharacterized protein (UPF0332 family)
MRLAAPQSSGPPRQVDLRRAISDAYYGIFHATLAAAADYFVGASKRSTSQYVLVYRSISHGALHELCAELKKPAVSRLFVRHVPPGGFGLDVKAYADGFLELQEKRLLADYDPQKRYRRLDAVAAIASAQRALTRFKNTVETEREAFLALLVVKPTR